MEVFMCRICLQINNDVDSVPIFLKTQQDETLARMIEECADVQILEFDNMPQYCCKDCMQEVEIAFKMRRKCRESDQKLRQLNNETTYSVFNLKIETFENENCQSERSDFREIEKLEESDQIEKESSESSGAEQDDSQDELDEVEKCYLNETEIDNHETEAFEKPQKKVKKYMMIGNRCCGCKQKFANSEAVLAHSKLVHEPLRIEDSAKPFECSVCFKRFGTKPTLRTHRRKIFKSFKCTFCGKKFMHEKTLNDHLTSHTDELLIRCCGCREDFPNKEILKQHSAAIHAKDKTEDETKPFECDICFRRYAGNSSLVGHKRLVSRHQCDICNQIFMKKICLTEHEKTHKGEKANLKRCCGCKLEFESEELLMEHSKSVHLKEKIMDETKPFECNICYKRVATKDYLATHKKKVYKDVSYQCTLCGKVFSRQYDLTIHEKTHVVEKPFQCKICMKFFKNKSYLSSHRKLHTDDSKNHICQVCGSAFRKKDALKAHLVVHSTERNFACALCPSTFNRKFCLKEHMRVHTGEKPHPCMFCDKKYAKASDLKRHMLAHTGGEPAKPHQCNYCGRRYPRKYYLNVHIERQHLAKQRETAAASSEPSF